MSSAEPAVTVALRAVADDDLPIFFEHQRDPDACRMAAFPSREREAFDAHWAKIRADPCSTIRTIVFDGRVAGNICAWEMSGLTFVGYWIGRDLWGKGVATRALRLFLDVVTARPIHAHVATANAGSIRVLEKCGFIPVEGSLETGADGVEEILYRFDR